MTLREGPSGPVVSAQLLLAAGTAGSLVNLARLPLTLVRSIGGISIVSNRLQVTQPGWYELTGHFSAEVPDAFDVVFAARLSTPAQQTESQIPLDDASTSDGIGCAPVENLFYITDPSTELVEIVNVSGNTAEVVGATLCLKRVG